MSNPHEDYYRAEVIDVRRLTPNMVRIRFGGEDLRRFSTSGFADERICVFFPLEGERHTPEPVYVDGHLDYSDAPGAPQTRSYTVRGWDAERAELDIDFVVHAGGVAARWAIDARSATGRTQHDRRLVCAAGPNQVAAVAGRHDRPPGARPGHRGAPRGREGARDHRDHRLDDRQTFATAGEVTYEWIHGTGHGLRPSALLGALNAYEMPDGPGYLWLPARRRRRARSASTSGASSAGRPSGSR